jgi:hypothetical protein
MRGAARLTNEPFSSAVALVQGRRGRAGRASPRPELGAGSAGRGGAQRRRLDLCYGQIQQFIVLPCSSGHASGQAPLVVRHQTRHVRHYALSCSLLLIGSKP